MVLFGQIVVGPPGSGKTFYCRGMQSFMHAIDRKCAIINLDFANDTLPYEASIDVRDLVSLERVMEEFDLGPNGGLIYCMEYLLENIAWLKDRLKEVESNGIACVLFDCPGQVELYTHHSCMKSIIEELIKGQKIVSSNATELDCRLCSVHLVDSFYCWYVLLTIYFYPSVYLSLRQYLGHYPPLAMFMRFLSLFLCHSHSMTQPQFI